MEVNVLSTYYMIMNIVAKERTLIKHTHYYVRLQENVLCPAYCNCLGLRHSAITLRFLLVGKSHKRAKKIQYITATLY